MLSLTSVSKLFGGISKEEAAVIEKTLREKHLPEGSVIFSEGDPSDSIYIIKNGLIKLVSFSEKGEETILRILKRGSMFGELLLAEKRRCLTAEAISDVDLLVISREEFLHILESIPAVRMNFIEMLSKRLLKMAREIANFGHTWSYQRLGIVLLELVEEHGVETPEGLMIPFPLTHEDLANFIGSTRETVTHQIKRLRRRGLLRRMGRHIIINKTLLDKFVHS